MIFIPAIEKREERNAEKFVFMPHKSWISEELAVVFTVDRFQSLQVKINLLG